MTNGRATCLSHNGNEERPEQGCAQDRPQPQVTAILIRREGERLHDVHADARGCQGCKFATGQVSTQCGHSPAGKSRMTGLVADDRDDRHRVKTWFTERRIDSEKESMGGKPRAIKDPTGSGLQTMTPDRQPRVKGGGGATPPGGIGLARGRDCNGGGGAGENDSTHTQS